MLADESIGVSGFVFLSDSCKASDTMEPEHVAIYRFSHSDIMTKQTSSRCQSNQSPKGPNMLTIPRETILYLVMHIMDFGSRVAGMLQVGALP